MDNAVEIIRKLYYTKYNDAILSIEPLMQSGSYRQYFRITTKNNSVLGVYNTDLQENKAYLSFSKTFLNAGIKVPEILLESEDQKSYLVQDLGKCSLWDIMMKNRGEDHSISNESKSLYKKTLKALIDLQTKGIENLDLSYCYPRDAFDKQSMLWDLNYFKYFFLRLTRIGFDEQLLENDIQKLSSDLDAIDRNYFLFRDFQSRNIIINNNEPYFIDFQGGRKGAIYYDIASLLYDANVELNNSDINELLTFYYQEFNVLNSIKWNDFNQNFRKFAIIRLTQALGAFGLRGIVEKKPHFKKCIPFAISALNRIFEENTNINVAYPELYAAISKALKSDYIELTLF